MIALWSTMMVSDACVLSPTMNDRREVQEASEQEAAECEGVAQAGLGMGFWFPM